MAAKYVPITLNCINDSSQCSWQSYRILVPEGTTYAGLAELVGSEKVCPYDIVFEHVPFGEGWSRDSVTIVNPRNHSYHVNVTNEVLDWLRQHEWHPLEKPILRMIREQNKQQHI